MAFQSRVGHGLHCWKECGLLAYGQICYAVNLSRIRCRLDSLFVNESVLLVVLSEGRDLSFLWSGRSDLKLARTGVKVLLPASWGELYLAGTLGVVVGVHFFVMNASRGKGFSPQYLVACAYGPSRACATQWIVTWLILPVVICLSQRLSHACLSINKFVL